MTHALLITGRPGIGKTTVLRRVVEALRDRPARGFLTDEVREGGRRTGFRIVALSGAEAVLADVDLASPHRVGRYGVDVAALEKIVAQALSPTDHRELVVIDEIGKMECLSPAFEAAVQSLLHRRQPLLATVAKGGRGLIAEVKRYPGAELWEVTEANRDQLPDRIAAWVAER
jgi:nucleoside-triphosphatase